MKYLYLRYLNFRLWMFRRRLRYAEPSVASSSPWETMPMPNVPPLNRKAERLDYVKIGIASFGVASMWLIFFLRPSGPVEVKPSPAVPSIQPNLNTHHE